MHRLPAVTSCGGATIRQVAAVATLVALAVLAALTAYSSRVVEREGMGRLFHPALCNASGNSSATAADSCADLRDPALAALPVALPPGGLTLVSGDSELERLGRQLQGAVEEGWPLVLARRHVRAALEHVSRDGVFTKPPIRPQHSGHAAGWRFVSSAVRWLSERGTGLVVPCEIDPSMPVAFATRYLFAATLGNAGHAMPNAVLQLLRVVSLLPHGYAYVSVYESGSTDGTRAWLDLLQLLLVPLGVPFLVQAGGPAFSPSAASRVEFMALARNQAITPFFAAARGACDGSTPQPHCFSPAYVVFFDGTFFCANDVVRLMEYPVDLSCGVKLSELRQHRRAAQRRTLATDPRRAGGRRPATAGSGSGALARRLQQLSANGTHAQPRAAVLLPDVPPKFYMRALVAEYDAFRDLGGGLLTTHPPYVQHAATRASATAGLPFPAQCCWAGLAKVASAAFARGLRFRPPLHDECATAECSLLCDDLHRLGMQRVLVDPAVRTSDQLHTKALFHTDKFPFFYYTKWETSYWSDVAPLMPFNFWDTAAPHPVPEKKVSCCTLKAGHRRPLPSTDCQVYDVMRDNYTATFLEGCAAQHGDATADVRWKRFC